jgi:ribosomal protein S21
MKKTYKKAKTNVAITTSRIPREMDWSFFSPLEVKVFGNYDRAVKSFRTLVQADGVLALHKQRQGYEKPSEKKRRKHDETMQRLAEAEIKQKKILSGEYEKEKQKKLEKKERRKKERDDRIKKNETPSW